MNFSTSIPAIFSAIVLFSCYAKATDFTCPSAAEAVKALGKREIPDFSKGDAKATVEIPIRSMENIEFTRATDLTGISGLNTLTCSYSLDGSTEPAIEVMIDIDEKYNSCSFENRSFVKGSNCFSSKREDCQFKCSE